MPRESEAGEALGELFCRLAFLESKTEGGLIFDLVTEITDAAGLINESHARGTTLRLLAEALRRDSHFLSRHPTTLFQCLWNQCWWHDCPEAARHYEGAPVPPVLTSGLHKLMEAWRDEKKQAIPAFSGSALSDHPACHWGGVSYRRLTPVRRRFVMSSSHPMNAG